MSKADEGAFLQYLRSSGDLVILPATSSSSDFPPVAALPEPSEEEATRKFWLQNRDSMQNWIRRGFKHLTLLTYVGPGAQIFREDGGLLH